MGKKKEPFSQSFWKTAGEALFAQGEKKDLILFVRICCFGALIRGLRNLGASLKRF